MPGRAVHDLRLQRRGRLFVYRRRVPVDLVPLLGGRREIVRSLRTRAVKSARRLAALLDARVWRLFDAVRQGGMDAREVEELIERLCGDYLRQLVTEDRSSRREEPGDDDHLESIDLVLDDMMEEEAERLERGKVDHVREDAAALLAKVGQELDENALDALLWELVRTRLVAFRQMREEREGDAVGLPRVALHAPSRALSRAPTTPSMALSELIRRYIEDSDGKIWAPRTAQMAKTALAEFLSVVGDRPVREVAKEGIRRYRLALETMPAKPPARGRLGPASIRRRMTGIIALFHYAQRHDLVDRNPAEGLKPPRSGQAHAERDAFTDEDLRAIFGDDYRAATQGKGEHALYWVPLTLLYTGARLGEVAQLEVADVVEVDGVACVRITEDGESGEKALKNAGSERTIPLHSGLLALGFLTYVEARRKAGDRRLFPRLKRGKNRGFGGEVTNWFLKWRKRHGITSRTKPLHSFRHTFATRLKAADVHEYTIAELLGHANESMTTGRYGKRLDVGKLQAAVEKLDVSGGFRELRAGN